jgi:predicted kinase
MNIAYIMRGVPGSGKSTVAKMIAGGIGKIHSTDDLFYTEGEYHFDPAKLSDYHEKNFRAFCQSLEEKNPVVICDNTNIKRWYFARYVEVAKKSGYMVVFVVLPHPDPEIAAKRNLHKVTSDKIRKMIFDWEN